MAKFVVFLYAATLLHHGVVANTGDCEDNISISLLQMDIHLSAHADANQSEGIRSMMGSRHTSNLVAGSLDGKSRQGLDMSSDHAERLPDFDKPRVYMGNHCGGTSWIHEFITQLLEAHGYKTLVINVSTTLVLGINGETVIINPTDPDVLREQHANATKEGRTLVFMPSWPHWEPWRLQESVEIVQAMKDLGSYFVGSYRGNAVDRLVCDVKDGFLSWPGYPISAQTGEETDIRGPDKRDVVDPDLQVYLFPEKVVEAVETEFNVEKSTMSLLAKPGMFPDMKHFSYEDLYAFEADAGLEKGVTVWSKLLGELGLVADPQKLRAALGPLVGTRPLQPHSSQIYNFEQVKDTLAPHREYFEYLRL